MKVYLFLIIFLIASIIKAQEKAYKIYNYTELFEMIKSEKDSVFTLENAIVKLDTVYDMRYSYQVERNTFNTWKERFFTKDSIKISKELKFNNVIFENPNKNTLNNKYEGAFHHIYFKEKVTFNNSIVKLFRNTFLKEVRFNFKKDIHEVVNSVYKRKVYPWCDIKNNDFKNGLDLYSSPDSPSKSPIQLIIRNNTFQKSDERKNMFIWLSDLTYLDFSRNIFKGEGDFDIELDGTYDIEIDQNNFGDFYSTALFALKQAPSLFLFTENKFKKPVLLSIGKLKQDYIVDWSQFSNGVTEYFAFFKYLDKNLKVKGINDVTNLINTKDTFNRYFNQYRIQDKNGFKLETRFLGKFYTFYKSQYDMESANALYVHLKNNETKRLKYLYQKDPSFKKFFKWKVNQFLKLFSDYGTDPSKAIIVSVYVILIFALIYLFFPNHWDNHGKNRIVNRYTFFLKYINKNVGMQEVYFEDSKSKIMDYESFKNLIDTSNQKVPKFFLVTALPLYKWAISGIKITEKLLKKIDIVQGRWSELPKHKRIWKSFLLIFIFLVAILFDVFIKILNALMLSVNTFTTLGFGEIPIKGLPRYLAIIQGFIGWFMLTIFSVSLISQLLN